MRTLNLTKRLFWIIASFIIGATLLITADLYYESLNTIEKRALSRAKSLQTYFISMRYVYHHQFLDSNLDLNDSTVGFLPAHAASLISDEFSKRSEDGITIRNVSDRPRNPDNQADHYERDAIRYFTKHKEAKERFTEISNGDAKYFFYSAPLRIEPYCIQCHGFKKEVLPYIAKRYTTGYNYKIGDVRGITSIKIPGKIITEQTLNIFWKETALNWTIILFLLTFIYYAIHQITRKNEHLKEHLEDEVKKRTAELETTSKQLQRANEYQEHLFSILRTVADTNQILITAQTLDELIDQTASCLIGNQTFFSVKISLLEGDQLAVKALYGIDDEWHIVPIEQIALDRNTSIILSDFSGDVSEECKQKVQKFGITSVYIAALRKDKFAANPFGTIMICTRQKDGFTAEETAMIDELSGDLGFAINSFYQKENIIKLSFYDPLTELPNRRLLLERFEQAILASARTRLYGSLLFIDLDNFKAINDLKGHAAGDEILQLMGKRLTSILRQSDTVSRFGGDEFIVLIENIGENPTDAASAVQITASKILEMTKEPFILDGHPFYLTASIGIVLFDGKNATIDQLFSYADSAMYAAKNSGRDTIRFYDSQLQESMAEQARLIHELRMALSLNQLYVVYQEQVDVRGVTEGVEALMRWEHPEFDTVPPSRFIPLAESNGIIIALGDWIFEKAIHQLKEWANHPIKKNWRISVNVSPRQFEDEHFIPKLKTQIELHRVNPSQIRLELTEGLLIHDTKAAMEKINTLKAIGFTLSIDDFGTGYSSLSYLKNLAIDELKIDQSFVRALPESLSDKIIIQTIITIGKTFNLEVIAEGVETLEQFELLRDMDCNAFQGYFFSYPQREEYYK